MLNDTPKHKFIYFVLVLAWSLNLGKKSDTQILNTCGDSLFDLPRE